MANTYKLIKLACMAALGFLVAACGPAGTAGVSQNDSMTKEGVTTPPSKLYAMEPEPLSPAECGSCHNSQYNWLRNKGGRHQFECTSCHEQFHAYNPKKDNWDAIMPKCDSCHDLPHGKDFPACLECHQQPHAPKEILFAKLEETVAGQGNVVACAACHATQGTEFANMPSKHNTEVNCQGCHAEVHGTIPSCLDCHDPHVENQQYQDCLSCHSPHSAANIKQYPESVPNRACSSCHSQPYNNLLATETKHSSLQCASCHASHGKIPACQDCHAEPHNKEMLSKFAGCAECHQSAHSLIK